MPLACCDSCDQRWPPTFVFDGVCGACRDGNGKRIDWDKITLS